VNISPLNTIQEQQIGQPHECWRILVGCILLNLTHGRQVRPILHTMFTNFPGPRTLVEADDEALRPLIHMLRPLGLYNRRLAALRAMSGDYVKLWQDRSPRENAVDGTWALQLYGCGQYAVDSLNVFVYGILENVSSDTWINDYIKWRKSNGQI
jgi:adenine-specific DNA glycosylase